MPSKFSFTRVLQREPTEEHRLFGEWITQVTGYQPDVKTIQLALALRSRFQQTPDRLARQQTFRDEKVMRAEQLAVRRIAQKLERKVKLAADKAEKAAAVQAKAAAELAEAEQRIASGGSEETVSVETQESVSV